MAWASLVAKRHHADEPLSVCDLNPAQPALATGKKRKTEFLRHFGLKTSPWLQPGRWLPWSRSSGKRPSRVVLPIRPIVVVVGVGQVVGAVRELPSLRTAVRLVRQQGALLGRPFRKGSRREPRAVGSQIQVDPPLEVVQIVRVVGTGNQFRANLGHRRPANVVLTLIRDKDPSIVGNRKQPLQAKVGRNLPALDVHADGRGEIPLPVPVFSNEVVNGNGIADRTVVQRQGDVELVVPVAEADLVANLPVHPVHDLLDAGGEREDLVLEGVVGGRQRQAWWHHEMMTDARNEGYAEGWDAAVEFMKGSK